MTITWLVKYEPLLEIVTFSWKKYYIKEKNKTQLEKDLETKKFLNFKWDLVNVASIDRIIPATEGINQVESKLIWVNIEKSQKIRSEIYLRKETKPHKTLTDWVIENIFLKYNS